MANNETTTLPAYLTLTENGYHEPLPYWRNPEVDDEEWISYGWKAITYEGHVHYSHKEKANVQQWLAEHGYQDTGDGSHYQRTMQKITVDAKSLRSTVNRVLDDLIATLQGDESTEDARTFGMKQEQAAVFDEIALAKIQGKTKALGLLKYSHILISQVQADENAPKFSLTISLDADI